MLKKTIALTLTALICALAMLTTAANAGPKNPCKGPMGRVVQQFIGTWKLKSSTLIDEQGAVLGYPYGDSPGGRITYTCERQMWAHVAGGTAAGPTGAVVWYTGTFRVAPRRHLVLHDVEYSMFPSYPGTTQVRQYEFAGRRHNRLTLATEPAGPEGQQTQLVLHWKKVRARRG